MMYLCMYQGSLTDPHLALQLLDKRSEFIRKETFILSPFTRDLIRILNGLIFSHKTVRVQRKLFRLNLRMLKSEY